MAGNVAGGLILGVVSGGAGYAGTAAKVLGYAGDAYQAGKAASTGDWQSLAVQAAAQGAGYYASKTSAGQATSKNTPSWNPKDSVVSGFLPDKSIKPAGYLPAYADPKNIRFTQDSISPNFQGGGTVDELADALRSGRVHPGDVPPIRIFERDGLPFTLDNRRLKAFQDAGVHVPWTSATSQQVEREAWKLTTKCAGETIRVRGK